MGLTTYREIEMKELKIIYKKPNELIQADYNPRKISDNDFSQLKKSLSNFECVEPIIVNINPDRFNIIIGGHQRLKALIELGYSSVPCIELNIDIDKEKELNVRLNKNTGEFDINLLIENFNIEDLSEYGFEDSILNSMNFDFEEQPEYSEPDTEKESITISFLKTDRKYVEDELNRIVGKFVNCAWM